MASLHKERFSLMRLIISDLIKHQKISLLLIALVIGSAMSVLWFTQQTRKQLFAKEQLFLERDVLESEWRNLIIEENVLAEHSRIEQKASGLGMQYALPKNETVVIIKTN